jgi:hypothetical protein
MCRDAVTVHSCYRALPAVPDPPFPGENNMSTPAQRQSLPSVPSILSVPTTHLRAAIRDTIAMECADLRAPCVSTLITFGHDRDTLRTAVWDYGRAVHCQEVPPEAMVIAVKQITNECLPDLLSPEMRTAFVHAVVLWGVQAYYGVE